MWWKDIGPPSMLVPRFNDTEFPDGRVFLARNYCRNPRDPYNPSVTMGKFRTLWCYVREGNWMHSKVSAVECEKPKLCGECQPKKAFSSSYSYMNTM